MRYRNLIFVALLGFGCGTPTPATELEFYPIVEHPGAALTAVHGTSEKDVWMVGADDGSGPIVLHLVAEEWERVDTGIVGDLWWVQALADGTVLAAGSDANLYSFEDEKWSRLDTPGLGKHIIFGVWASAKDDIYAVGSEAGRNGFIWHYDGTRFEEIPLPDELERKDHDLPALFKVAGTDKGDVWIVGADGAVLRGDAKSGFRVVPSGTSERLFTVHVNDERAVIVGGGSQGLVLAADLTKESIELVDATPRGAPLLQGAWLLSKDECWLVGRDGTMFKGGLGNLEEQETPTNLEVESLHAVWVDPKGGVWTVGGNVISGTLDDGQALVSRAGVDEWVLSPEDIDPDASCPSAAVDPAPDASMARRFNEQLLNAIRRDVPRPTVHARNLLHASMAMWDAWAAYDTQARGVVYEEKEEAEDLGAARDEAIAYAAYRVLSYRYGTAQGGAVSQSCFDDFMAVLEFSPETDTVQGSSPAAVGNRIGQAIIQEFAEDGANEATNYADPDAYDSEQPPLIVDLPGVETDDPADWQQLILSEAVTQNGIPEGSGLRAYIGAHWRDVKPFALVRPEGEITYFPFDKAPMDMNDDLIDAAVDVLQKTAEIDIEDEVMMDISPGAYGNNSLGTNDGEGHEVNRITGEPYAQQRVLRGDFTRVLAEYWADGPSSETPPGHWNTIANYVADHPEHTRRLFGSGETIDPLAWDVHVYLALNGALHDAAIAAWELKRQTTTARPITLIRYLSGLGQSSDPDGPSYHKDGIPLLDNLVEVITERSSEAGERHAHLSRYIGEIAVRSWRGEPGDRKHDIGSVDWIRGKDWIPYQRRTFVTPAFPGYVSGHSTFSRAGAEVLTQLTGDSFFPGGLGSAARMPGYLVFEYGPSQPIELQWGTYYDAADQAGQSRLWGGIHIRNDDFDGRKIGAQVAELSIKKSRYYFGD